MSYNTRAVAFEDNNPHSAAGRKLRIVVQQERHRQTLIVEQEERDSLDEPRWTHLYDIRAKNYNEKDSVEDMLIRLLLQNYRQLKRENERLTEEAKGFGKTITRVADIPTMVDAELPTGFDGEA